MTRIFRVSLSRHAEETYHGARRLEAVLKGLSKEVARGELVLIGTDPQRTNEHTLALLYRVNPPKPRRRAKPVRRERWRKPRKPLGIERFAQGS